MTSTTFAEALKLAADDRDSVIELTRDLVQIPSRGGIDPYKPVLDRMESWLRSHALLARRLAGPGGETIALVSEISGDPCGPRYVLDACLDTAPFRDEGAWSHPPTSGAPGQAGARPGEASRTGEPAAPQTRNRGTKSVVTQPPPGTLTTATVVWGSNIRSAFLTCASPGDDDRRSFQFERSIN